MFICFKGYIINYIMQQQILKTCEEKMKAGIEHLNSELAGVRSGRANAGLVDSIKINVYGSETPLKAIATISTPDAKTIQIQPWDGGNLAAIEKAITEKQSLGLTPNNDGRVIRLNVPPMSEETRSQMVKLINEKAEAANISLRNARHEAINDAKSLEKKKEFSRDDLTKIEKDVTSLIERYQKQVQDMIAGKEQELMQT